MAVSVRAFLVPALAIGGERRRPAMRVEADVVLVLLIEIEGSGYLLICFASAPSHSRPRATRCAGIIWPNARRVNYLPPVAAPRVGDGSRSTPHVCDGGQHGIRM
jgi:hypothetical protein